MRRRNMTNSSRDLIKKSLLTLLIVAIILLVIVPISIKLIACTTPFTNVECRALAIILGLI